MRTVNPEALFDFLDDEGHRPVFREDDTEIAIVCPLCGDERRRLYIAASSGVWICFRCGEQGSLLDLLIDVLGIEPATAMAQRAKLRRPSGGDIRFTTEVEYSPVGVELPVEFRSINEGFNAPYLDYLVARGIPIRRAEEFGVGYCSAGYYAQRIIVPVRRGGKLYTFVARSIRDNSHPAKVLYPQHSAPSETLFNYDRVAEYGRPTIILVEGVFDVLTHLYDTAMAVLGSNLSQQQVALLREMYKPTYGPVIILFDGDSAGRHGAREAADMLTGALVPCRIAYLPEGKDPASATKRGIVDALDRAQDYQL